MATSLDETLVEGLRSELRGALLQPNDPGYDEARKVWNAMIDKRPALIARCTGTADVVRSVTFAREHGLLLSVKGGGHNVAGNAVCDDGFMIDLSMMRGVHVDPGLRRARVQPGANWGDLDHETQLYGLMTPGGVVSTTGVAGFTLSGSMALSRRKWESALLVNVDNDTLRRILESPEAMAAVESIEGWRSLGDNIIESIINKSEKVKELKNKAKDGTLTGQEKKELTQEEKDYKSKRKLVQEKLIKFATRIPAFMYMTDYRENTLQDVITKLEPDLFRTVTGLTVADFHLLVRLKVFNTEHMNQAVFAFRRYEDASLRYTGVDSHPGLTHYGLYDTVVARE
jgi:hypothetical protein